MRIAQIAPIAERVPAEKYGGTERVVYELTEQLVKRRHDVTLFATGNSKTSAKLSAVVPASLRELKLKNPYGLNEWTFLHFGLAYARQDEFDIIHDHTYAMSVPTASLSVTPVLNTMHGAFHESNIPLYSTFNRVHVNTISYSQIPQNSKINLVGTVYHGMNMNHYPFSRTHDGYLLYIGRMSAEKGVHYAIEVAIRLRIPLIIAARISQCEKQYYHDFIKPYLPNKYITVIGEVEEEERNKLMSKAMCFLHPVTWPEPFGLTLIESMACGTPVVAFSQGSIPELIQHGKTGFVVNTVDQMIEAIKKIDKIDRKYCRNYSLKTFSAEKMAEGYEALYHKILIEKDQDVVKPIRSFAKYKNIANLISPLFPNVVLNSNGLSISKSK